MTTATTHQTPTTQTKAPRAIQGIYAAPPIHWVGNGFRVEGFFSHIPDVFERMSPFLLLDYNPPIEFAVTTARRGVGVHPHRGFETVTIAWDGHIAHHDSAGNGGVIGPGDVQWMTAASGILHKEYHEEQFARRGGQFHMAQLWVNLPKANKMDAPGYQSLLASDMGIVHLDDGAGQVRIIAGKYRGVSGPAKTHTPINLFDVKLNEGGRTGFDFPARQNTGILVMSGGLVINGDQHVPANSFVVFENDGEVIDVLAEADSHFLLLNGEPIDEPVVQYGPFVMNTEQEIRQAMLDVRAGKFGELEDE